MTPRHRFAVVVLGLAACAALPPAAGGQAPGAVRFDYPCKFIKATQARRLLNELTDGGSKFSTPVDERTNTLRLHGPADRVAEAKAILGKIDSIDSPDKAPILCPSPTLKVHLVPPGTAEALARTLQKVSTRATTRISAAGGNRLLVYATPEDQDAIAQQVRAAAPPAIEVISLAVLDAVRTVEVLQTLFGAGPGGRGPVVLADPARNAVIVRGTSAQVDEVRAALKALGETAAPAGGTRVITLEQGDAATLAEAIQGVMQKLRNNPVRVVVPAGKSEAAPKPPAKGGPAAKPGAGKPVTLTAAGNKLLVASDDPQALALALDLARLFTAPQTGGLEVLRVQHGSAAEAARIIDEAFNGRMPATGRRPERVRVVADPSSNSLLVRASPLDLLSIRKLLARSLDSAERGDAAVQTHVLGPLRHAVAGDLAKVLREVYRDAGKPAPTFAFDQRTNTVILRGSAAVYADARKLVEQLDVKAEKKP